MAGLKFHTVSVYERKNGELPGVDRAKDEATFQKIVRLINNFKEYYQKHDQPVYENPSPGNKAGGIAAGESFKDQLAKLIDLVVATANGQKTVKERTGVRDIAIFKTG